MTSNRNFISLRDRTAQLCDEAAQLQELIQDLHGTHAPLPIQDRVHVSQPAHIVVRSG